VSHSIFGWDLPPGCRVSDIPGNRPEDERWEAIYDGFFKEERIAYKKYGTTLPKNYLKQLDRAFKLKSLDIDAIITDAIEYGMEVEQKASQANREENKYYDRMTAERAFEDAKDKDEALKKVLYYLGLSKEKS